jgi:hypothetical protein
MGVQVTSVKGRPNQKLIENYFNRLWTRLSLELPYSQVGRYRDDDKLGQVLYCKCQVGREDPRKYFPMLDVALAAIENSIRWLNTEPVESREYGTWVPLERWMLDMEQHPRPAADTDGHLWLAAPVMEERTVTRGMVTVTADGPLGERPPFHFVSPDLWTLNGKRVRVAFDPLQSPAVATIARVDREEVLCTAAAFDPFAEGDVSREVREARELRAMMRREYRVLLPDRKTGAQRLVLSESERRTPEAALEIHGGELAGARAESVAPSESQVAAAPARPAQPETELRATRADVSRSLRRRAAALPPVQSTF